MILLQRRYPNGVPNGYPHGIPNDNHIGNGNKSGNKNEEVYKRESMIFSLVAKSLK
jgi:hypothetical protein